MIKQGLRRIAQTGRTNKLAWRYIHNLIPTVRYQLHRPTLAGESRRVLDDLNRDGVAITSVDSLLESSSLFAELCSTVSSLEKTLSDEIAAARVSVGPNGKNTSKPKDYLFKLLGDRPQLDTNSVFVRFALQKRILQIVNGYYGLFTRLEALNVWKNFATSHAPHASQLWHRDPDDPHCTMKVFVYLTDVNTEAGPLVYAAGTHSKGHLRREPAFRYKDGNTPRSDDTQMTEIVTPECWIKCVGEKGTIVFMDGRGFHKGGDARQRDRTVFVSMFTSRPAWVINSFDRPAKIQASEDRARAFALSAKS
jgi:hypothetical protein